MANTDNSAVIRFLDEYKSEYTEQLNILQDKMNKMTIDDNQKLLKYEMLREKMSKAEAPENLVKKYQEEVLRLKNENTENKKNIEKYHLENEKICKGFAKKLGIEYKKEMGNLKNFNAFFNEVKTQKEKQREMFFSMSTGKEYQSLKEERMKYEAQLKLYSPKIIKDKIAITQKALNEAKQKLAKVSGLIKKHNAIKKDMTKLNKAEKNLAETYKDLKEKSFPEKRYDALCMITSDIPEGVDKKNSPEFKILQSRFKQLSTILQSYPEDKALISEVNNELKAAAQHYINVRTNEIRPWPFATNQRYKRINGARNLLNFCEITEKLIKDYDPAEISIQKYIESEQRAHGKFDAKEAFENDIEKMTDTLQAQGKIRQAEKSIVVKPVI